MKQILSIIYLLIFILLLTISVSAQQDLRITSNIEGSTAYVDYVFRLEPNIDSFSLDLPKDSIIIYAKDDFGDLSYDLLDDRINLSFVPSDSDRLVLLKLKTKSLVNKKARYSEFVCDFKVTVPFKFVLNLPDTTILKTVESSSSGELKEYSDGAFIEWNIDTNSSRVFLVRYSTTNQGYWSWIVFGLGLIVIFILVLFLHKKKNKSNLKKVEVNNEVSIDEGIDTQKNELKTEKKEEVKQSNNMNSIQEKIKLLNEKEKAVVEYIMKNDSCLQSNLQKEIGYTKSNLTKIIQKLEFRGIVQRNKIGKINRLHLGEKMR